jgi:hypothetical protein
LVWQALVLHLSAHYGFSISPACVFADLTTDGQKEIFKLLNYETGNIYILCLFLWRIKWPVLFWKNIGDLAPKKE